MPHAALTLQQSNLSHNAGARDTRLVDALIASFGYGDAYEMYWSTMHALEKFPLDWLRSALRHALAHGKPGARLWSAKMLGRQRNSEDRPLLIEALSDVADKVRLNAQLALDMLDLKR
jgi:hypothetical protein